MGADSPGTKTVFVGVPWAIKSIGQIGGPAPGSGKTPKLPHPQNVKTHFQKTWSSIRKNRSAMTRYAMLGMFCANLSQIAILEIV